MGREIVTHQSGAVAERSKLFGHQPVADRRSETLGLEKKQSAECFGASGHQNLTTFHCRLDLVEHRKLFRVAIKRAAKQIKDGLTVRSFRMNHPWLIGAMQLGTGLTGASQAAELRVVLKALGFQHSQQVAQGRLVSDKINDDGLRLQTRQRRDFAPEQRRARSAEVEMPEVSAASVRIKK